MELPKPTSPIKMISFDDEKGIIEFAVIDAQVLKDLNVAKLGYIQVGSPPFVRILHINPCYRAGEVWEYIDYIEKHYQSLLDCSEKTAVNYSDDELRDAIKSIMADRDDDVTNMVAIGKVSHITDEYVDLDDFTDRVVDMGRAAYPDEND